MDQGLIIRTEGTAVVCCSEEKVEPKGKVLDLLVHLHSIISIDLQVLIVTKRTRFQIQVAEMRFLHRVAGHSLRYIPVVIL